MKIFDLSGGVAVIIGATGALGGAIAEGLAEAGAAVAVVGRNEERGRARVAAIESRGGKAAFSTPTRFVARVCMRRTRRL